MSTLWSCILCRDGKRLPRFGFKRFEIYENTPACVRASNLYYPNASVSASNALPGRLLQYVKAEQWLRSGDDDKGPAIRVVR